MIGFLVPLGIFFAPAMTAVLSLRLIQTKENQP